MKKAPRSPSRWTSAGWHTLFLAVTLSSALGACSVVDNIRPVGEQPAGSDEIPGRVDGRNTVASNSRCDQIPLRIGARATKHDHAIGRTPHICSDSKLKLIRIANIDRSHLHSE